MSKLLLLRKNVNTNFAHSYMYVWWLKALYCLMPIKHIVLYCIIACGISPRSSLFTKLQVYRRVLSTMIHTHKHNSNLIWRTVSLHVDEVIPSDRPRRVASRVIQWYGLIHETWYSTQNQVTIMIICLLYAFFLTFFLFQNLFWSIIPKNCGNVCHNVTFLDIASTCFPSLVPCLQFTLRNVAAKAGNRR